MPRSLVRLLSCILIASLISSCSHLPHHADTTDIFNPDDMDRMLTTDPATLSPEQFYRYEFAVIAGYSGSGGHFLEGPQIDWLRRAEAAFQARGIKLKDKWQRGYVIADSYLNHQRYEHAYEEFKVIHNQAGMELAEWFINNKGLQDAGKVNIVEYDGEITCEASETARVENDRYLFVAYFKGPVYRYDKLIRKHMLIYAPRDKYDWCDYLSFNGRQLVIRLRDDAGQFEFDNKTREIAERRLLTVSDLIEIHKLAHPDLPLPAEEQAQ